MYGYLLVTGGEVVSEFHGDGDGPGILSAEGTDTQIISIPSPGQYRLDIVVYGTGPSLRPNPCGNRSRPL